MLKNLQNKAVLVISGYGFIDPNLCETSLSNNIETICLDSFSTGKRKNINPFLKNIDFKLVKGNIPCSLASVRRAKKTLNYNRI